MLDRARHSCVGVLPVAGQRCSWTPMQPGSGGHAEQRLLRRAVLTRCLACCRLPQLRPNPCRLPLWVTTRCPSRSWARTRTGRFYKLSFVVSSVPLNGLTMR